MESDNTPVTQSDNSACLNENGEWRLKPNTVVDQITEQECENLKSNAGLDGAQASNCGDLNSLICDIKQEVEQVASNRVMVIAPNDLSKCDDSEDPTLASMWSRILKFAQAASCVMCTYDPFVATILKSGKYPEILMGAATEGGYPTWVKPDELPQADSKRPVTSGGIQEAIKQAILGVWHKWEEHPTFDYFAQTIDGSDDPHNLTNQMTDNPANSGDTALVASDGVHNTALYTFDGTDWVFTKELDSDDGLTNFAVSHIGRGYYATKDVYYFYDGTNGTWQVMDADLTELEKKVKELEGQFNGAVFGKDTGEGYLITTRPTLAQAQAVACDNDRMTLTFVTG